MKRLVIGLIVAFAALGAARLRAQGTFRVGIDVVSLNVTAMDTQNHYVTDLEEGLVMVGAGTLLDGNPLNNFLKKDATFNPGGILCGARSITIAGTNAYICCTKLFGCDIDDFFSMKVWKY